MQGTQLPLQKTEQDSSPYPNNANNCFEPIQINCPCCHTINETRITKDSCNIKSFLWCFLGGCFCCFIPGLCKNQTDIKHFCTSCGSQVGVKEATCC